MQRCPVDTIQTLAGDAVTGASVTVYIASTPGLATIYSDNGITPIGNPITSDANGQILFYAADGRYDLLARKAGFADVWYRDIIFDDPTQGNIAGTDASGALVTATGWTTSRQLASILSDNVYALGHSLLNNGADTTTVFNTFIAYLNGLSNPSKVILEPGIYLCGKLNAITQSNVTFLLDGVIIKSLANSLAVANDTMITFSGANVSISGGTFDGNQAAYAASAACYVLAVSGNGARLDGLTVKNSIFHGASISSSDGMAVDCHFDDNASLGANLIAASDWVFTNCTFNRDGYGFHKTRTSPSDHTHSFLGFGLAIRYRSHHITLIGCAAEDCGRDGLNTNQGSYAIKFVGCKALRNDDGGFTIAADNTGTGLPGESESPRDIEYIDCEAANNWSSGLAVYQPTQNITVIGGRYYNNNRIAGSLATADSYKQGIFVAGGSIGINIDTKCYDDRQTCIITNNASGVLTATGWISGTKLYYPVVAIYNGTDMSFRGYGFITAESAGSVTISSATFNGVTIGAIVPGDYVSQCVQHNGVFFSNNVQGQVSVDGFGHKLGPADTGNLIFSGPYSGGQNIVLPKYTKSQIELLANPSFEVDSSSWTFTAPAGSGFGRVTSPSPVKSVGSENIIGGTVLPCYGDSTLIASSLSYASLNYVELSFWCYCLKRSGAKLYLFWDIGAGAVSTLVTHPGGGWRCLKVGAFMGPLVAMFARIQAEATVSTYWDEGSLRVVRVPTDDRDVNYSIPRLPT